MYWLFRGGKLDKEDDSAALEAAVVESNGLGIQLLFVHYYQGIVFYKLTRWIVVFICLHADSQS